MARLVVLSEGFAGRACDLKVEPTTIGRVDDNAFPIPEPSVSSHHAEVFLRGNDVIVRDLDSTNGTFINDQQVTGEAVLRPGQICRFGQVEVRLEGDARGGSAPSAGASSRTKFPEASMPQGVKLGEFDQGAKTVGFDKDSPFTKKKGAGTKLFLAIGSVLIVIVLGYIFWTLKNKL